MSNRILVVDDDLINRKLLNVLLKKNGFTNVIDAENGMEAYNIIKSEPIDIVLLDILMPVMDGIDLLKLLKSDDKYKDIPVAILTTDDSRRNEALNLGACAVLIKPIKEDELKKLLSSVF
jgi:CheY-like chemotaxis protein